MTLIPICVKRALVPAALLAALFAGAPCNVRAAGDGALIPAISFDHVPLDSAIKHLAGPLGSNVILDPHVPGVSPDTAAPAPVITTRWTNTTMQAALDDLLAQYKLTMVYSPATTVTRIAPADLGVQPVPASQVGTNDNGNVIPIIRMTAVPLNQAVTNLAKPAGLTVSFDAEASAPAFDDRQPVSFSFRKITVRQALAALLDNYNLVLTEDPATSTARIKLKPKN
jgi:type II secretory pathway component GspD/PulD (secretin)